MRPLALALAEVAVHRGGGEAARRQRLGHLVRGPLGPAEHHGQARGRWPAGCGPASRSCPSGARGTRAARSAAPGRARRAARPGRAAAGAGAAGPGVTTSPGMVAENSMVCRSAGVRSRIRSTSGRNPRSSILSASSSTRARTADRSRCRCPTRSSSRPGVPTTMSTAAAQRVDLRLVGPAAVDGEHPGAQGHAGHPQVVGDLAGQFPGRYHDERGTGAVGSLAGVSARCCSSGMPNASVLPVPVRAWPMMSCPPSATGRARLWMGNGAVMPTPSRATQIRSSTPRSRNVCAASTSGEPAAGLSSAGGSATDEVNVCVVSSISFHQWPAGWRHATRA